LHRNANGLRAVTGRHGRDGEDDRDYHDTKEMRHHPVSHFLKTSCFRYDSHSIALRIAIGRTIMKLAVPLRRFVAASAMLTVVVTVARAEEINDYPTAARAEYVYGCMKANGETRQAIEQCSCSVDVVASLMPYARYVTAETVLSMAQVQGNLGGQFRTSEQAATALNELRRAQAEAEVRCF
jgi:hypothetical protein